ncbi:MAG: PEP-CTERM sorting domain-containing protein [Rubrivivax sp.]|nr:MAG: PEP-CTERM sorting domain-containing protein [Rubrivivax sp.]
MKFALKSIVAAASFVAVSAASAATGYAWDVGSGTGSLTFSADALSAISASSSNLVTPALLPNIAGFNVTPGATNNAKIASGVVTLTFDNATVNGDTLTSLQSSNSFVNIKRTTIDENDVQQSNSIFMANFDVNLAESTIYADLYTRNNTAGTIQSFGKQAIFTATEPGGVTGGTGGVIVVDGITGNTVNGHADGALNGPLRMTASTANTVLSGLGLSTSATDPVAVLVRTANWGNTAASGNFTAPVPEPTTYAMIIAGLACVGAMSRRRKAA